MLVCEAVHRKLRILEVTQADQNAKLQDVEMPTELAQQYHNYHSTLFSSSLLLLTSVPPKPHGQTHYQTSCGCFLHK